MKPLEEFAGFLLLMAVGVGVVFFMVLRDSDEEMKK